MKYETNYSHANSVARSVLSKTVCFMFKLCAVRSVTIFKAFLCDIILRFLIERTCFSNFLQTNLQRG